LDWSLAIFVVVILFFAYRGYRNGLLKSVSRIVGLVAGYIASIFYSEQVSVILQQHSQLRGIVSFITASLILFVGASIAVGIVFWLINKLLPSAEKSTASSFGGATLGTLIGLIAAIAIVWTFVFVRDMSPASNAVATETMESSRIESLVTKVAGKAVGAAMTLVSAAPEIKSLSTALVEAPADTAQRAQRLAQRNDINALLNDPANRAILDSGDVKAVQSLPAFQQLANNPDMLALAESAGMLDQADGDTLAMQAALAGQVTDIWGRLQRVQNDQRVQEILNDPEFQQKVQSGNPLDLLTNDRLLELADIIFAEETSPAEGTASPAVDGAAPDPDPADDSSQLTTKKKTRLHSWTDENGVIHISDVDPDS
jgi:uncharacterized membrane protein required for colicin V production